MSNTDRCQWIDNDEGLYRWWKGSRLSKTAFIRENKAEIDAVIANILGGRRHAHYLVYGH